MLGRGWGAGGWGEKGGRHRRREGEKRRGIHQAPLPTGFSRQEYWSGLPCPPPGDLSDPGMEPASPALADGFFTTEPPGKPTSTHTILQVFSIILLLGILWWSRG